MKADDLLTTLKDHIQGSIKISKEKKKKILDLTAQFLESLAEDEVPEKEPEVEKPEKRRLTKDFYVILEVECRTLFTNMHYCQGTRMIDKEVFDETSNKLCSFESRCIKKGTEIVQDKDKSWRIPSGPSPQNKIVISPCSVILEYTEKVQ